MKGLNKILFVANGGETEHSALARAASLAELCRAELLTVMDISHNGNAFKNARTDASQADVSNCNGLTGEQGRFLVSKSAVLQMKSCPRVEFETERSIRQVVEATRKYDLVIKPVSETALPHFLRFGSDDRKLLRNSACPVWITRNLPRSPCESGSKLLAVIDLTHRDSESLARVVLAQAIALAQIENTQLEVVSTWRVPNELRLSGRRLGFIKLRKQMKKTYRNQLKSLLDEMQLPKKSGRLIHGYIREVIPEFVKLHGYDMVILGEHTDMMQVIVGNTAELLLDDVDCSILSINENMVQRNVYQSTVRSKAASRVPTVA